MKFCGGLFTALYRMQLIQDQSAELQSMFSDLMADFKGQMKHAEDLQHRNDSLESIITSLQTEGSESVVCILMFANASDRSWFKSAFQVASLLHCASSELRL